jgi:hypothetical protein
MPVVQKEIQQAQKSSPTRGRTGNAIDILEERTQRQLRKTGTPPKS